MSARPILAPWIVVAAAMAMLALNMGLRQTFGLFLEPITADIEISLASLSLAIAIQNLLWGLAVPFAGALGDRFGAGRVLVAGAVLYIAGLLVMAWGDSAFAMHLGAGVLVGLGTSATGVQLVLGAVARAVSEKGRSRALGIAATGGSVGQFLLLPASQVMIGSLGWVTALVCLAALAFLMVPLAAALTGRAPRRGEDGFEPQSLRAALVEAGNHNGFVLLNAGFFVCGFHVAFIGTHLPNYVMTCNLAAIVGATALSVVGFFNIIGGLAAGWLGGLYPKKYLLASIYFARAAAIALFMAGPKTEVTVYLFAAAFGLLWLSTVPLTSGLVGDIFGPRFMATLFGIVLLSHQVGAFFGAWFGGLSLEWTGSYDIVWGISILLGLAAAIAHLPIDARRVRRETVSPAS